MPKSIGDNAAKTARCVAWAACALSAGMIVCQALYHPSVFSIFKDDYPKLPLVKANLKALLSCTGGYWNAAKGIFFFAPSFAFIIMPGKFLLDKIFKDIKPDFLHLAASFALGFAATGYCLGLIGMGGYAGAGLGIFLILCGWAFMPSAYKFCKACVKKLFSSGPIEPKHDRKTVLLKVTILLWMALAGTACFTPVSDYDVLSYHWANPTNYINRGAISVNKYNFFSYLPQNAEMIYMWQLSAGSETSAKIFNFCIWALLTFSLVTFVKRQADQWTGWLAGAMFAFMPLGVIASYTPKNDLALALFCFLSIIFAADAFSGDENSRIFTAGTGGEEKYLLMSGLMAGAALGTKYAALPQFAVILCSIPPALRYADKTRDPAVSLRRLFTIFLFASLVFSISWYARNAFLTGNPLYPFAANIFPTRFQAPWHQPQTVQVFRENAVRQVLNPGELVMYIKSLLGVTTAKNPVISWGNSLTILLLPLLVFGVIYRPYSRYIIIAAGLPLIPGLLQILQMRMFLGQFCVIFGALAVCAGHVSSGNTKLRWALTIAMLMALMNPGNRPVYGNISAGLYSLSNGIDATDMNYCIGAETVHSNELEGIKRFVNDKLPKDGKLLFMGDARAAGFKREYYASSGYDTPVFMDWARNSGNALDFYALVKKSGVTHIVIFTSGFEESISSAEDKEHLSAVLTGFTKNYCSIMVKTDNNKIIILSVK